MGWKTIKDHYNIKHIVQFDKRREYGEEPVIMIGSPHISDLIVIRPSDGKILKKYKGGSVNKLLQALMPILDEDEKTGKLKDLIDAEDHFSRKLPVYYYGDGRHIRLTYCEHYGYPNCTIDGHIMYENHYCSKLKAAKYYLLYNSRMHWGRWWKYNVRVRFREINRQIKVLFRYDMKEVWDYIYVRCWGRFFVKGGKQ